MTDLCSSIVQKLLCALGEGEDKDVKKWAVWLMADPRDYANIVWGVDDCISTH